MTPRDWTPEARTVWRHVARNCGLDADDPAMVQALTAFAAEVARATRAEAAQAALDESADPPPGGTPWAWGYAAGRLDAAAAIEADEGATGTEAVAVIEAAEALVDAWPSLRKPRWSGRHASGLVAAVAAYRAARGTP